MISNSVVQVYIESQFFPACTSLQTDYTSHFNVSLCLSTGLHTRVSQNQIQLLSCPRTRGSSWICQERHWVSGLAFFMPSLMCMQPQLKYRIMYGLPLQIVIFFKWRFPLNLFQVLKQAENAVTILQGWSDGNVMAVLHVKIQISLLCSNTNWHCNLILNITYHSQCLDTLLGTPY